MPGELERLIQALLAPRQQTQVQTPGKLALSYETLESLSDLVVATYPVPAAHWMPDVTLTNYLATVLNDSPLAYWRFGETSGVVAADVTERYPGTYTGAVVLAQASLLTGDADYSVSAPSGTSIQISGLPFLAGPFTLELWIQTSTGYGQDLMKLHDGAGTGWRWAIGYNASTRMDFRTNGGSPSGPGGGVSDGARHHVVLTYDGSWDATFYRDGASLGGVGGHATPVEGSGALIIAQNSGIVIDEGAIYSAVLAPARILAHYQAGANTGGDGVTTKWGEVVWA